MFKTYSPQEQNMTQGECQLDKKRKKKTYQFYVVGCGKEKSSGSRESDKNMLALPS